MRTDATDNDPTENTAGNEWVGEPRLERVLVVISPDLVEPGAPEQSSLITRAVALAKATGCELEFLHVCYDESLTSTLFADTPDLRHRRKERLDRDATLMAELVVRLKGEGLAIKHDTRWDSPRTEAILRKIKESRPDLVMKQSREYGYFMGLMNNTDWDLIRQAPAHMWFVTEQGSNRIDRVITAIGASSEENGVVFTGSDYDVFRIGTLIADDFEAENIPVHAYQVPQDQKAYVAYTPEFGAPYTLAEPVSMEQTRREVAAKHGRSIEAFAKCMNLDPTHVRLAQGHPSDILLENAKELQADLIVMAARNLSRWERAFRSVTAEPVLADASCDVLFVKDARDASIPAASEVPAQGVPAFDLERAVVDPHRTFGSPQLLADTTDISVSMRQRILQIWEQDLRAQMAEENEGGSVRATTADLLDAINSARASLLLKDDDHVDEPLALTH